MLSEERKQEITDFFDASGIRSSIPDSFPERTEEELARALEGTGITVEEYLTWEACVEAGSNIPKEVREAFEGDDEEDDDLEGSTIFGERFDEKG